MSNKEANARIKINKLLEESGWRFFDNEEGLANVSLEPNVKLSQKDIDAFGDDFETTKNGFIDFLLLWKVPISLDTFLARFLIKPAVNNGRHF